MVERLPKTDRPIKNQGHTFAWPGCWYIEARNSWYQPFGRYCKYTASQKAGQEKNGPGFPQTVDFGDRNKQSGVFAFEFVAHEVYHAAQFLLMVFVHYQHHVFAVHHHHVVYSGGNHNPVCVGEHQGL